MRRGDFCARRGVKKSTGRAGVSAGSPRLHRKASPRAFSAAACMKTFYETPRPLSGGARALVSRPPPRGAASFSPAPPFLGRNSGAGFLVPTGKLQTSFMRRWKSDGRANLPLISKNENEPGRLFARRVYLHKYLRVLIWEVPFFRAGVIRRRFN